MLLFPLSLQTYIISPVRIELTGDIAMNSLLFGLNHLGIGGVFLYALNTVFAAVLFLVALAARDGLTVSGGKAEADLAFFVGVDLKLRVLFLFEALFGLIFDISDRSVLLYALDAVLDARQSVVDFAADSDYLAVARLEAVGEARFGLVDNKFTHNKQSFRCDRPRQNTALTYYNRNIPKSQQKIRFYFDPSR